MCNFLAGPRHRFSHLSIISEYLMATLDCIIKVFVDLVNSDYCVGINICNPLEHVNQGTFRILLYLIAVSIAIALL